MPINPLLNQTTAANFASTVAGLMSIVNILVWLMGGLAVVVFFYGIVRFVANAGDTHAHTAGYKMMLWGLAALFVLFTLGGLINFMCGSFLAQTGGCPNSYYTGGAPT